MKLFFITVWLTLMCAASANDKKNQLAEMLMIRQEDKLNSISVDIKGFQKGFNLLLESSNKVAEELRDIKDFLKSTALMFAKMGPNGTGNGLGGNELVLLQQSLTDSLTKNIENIFTSFSNVTDNKFAALRVDNNKQSQILNEIFEENKVFKSNLTDLRDVVENISPAGTCGIPWVSIDGQCYFFSNMKKTWSEAKDWCEGKLDGAKLAEPNNVFFLAQHQDRTFRTENREERAWVGASGTKANGWKWLSGKEIPRMAEYWAPSQPNHDENSKACAYLLEGELADWMCDSEYNFVCEK